jgi:glycosyltransferase involved in cell wall biosynthesis
LKRCLDSVVNQTYKNLEIICINDVTPDNCGQILAEYARKDSRFKIITHTHNQGAAAARNSGLDAACGQYIYFLDSDDYIDNDYLEKMTAALEKSDTDMVFNLNILYETDNKRKLYIPPAYNEVTLEGEFIPVEKAISETLVGVWARMYKKSFLDKYAIRFPQGYMAEDLYFHYLTYTHLGKAFIFKGTCYHYMQIDDSVSKHCDYADLFIMKIYDLIFDYFSHNNLLDKYDIKMFQLSARFLVNTEEKFSFCRMYFEKINKHLKDKKYLYNDLELFLATNILNSENFDEYKKRFGENVAMSFIRREKCLIN